MAELLNEFQNFVLKHHRVTFRGIYQALYNCKITTEAQNWISKGLNMKSTEKEFIVKQISLLKDCCQSK